MRRESAELRDWLRQPAAWAILAVGVAVSLFTWRTLSADVDEAARGYFESTVAEARSAMETRLRGYRVALRGMQGLFHAGEVDAAAFRRYAAALGPEARSLSYARRVAGAEKAAYERSVRRIHPTGSRAEYLVLQFIEPPERFQTALGLDLFGDPARRQSIERARDGGALVGSPPFVMIAAPDAGKAVSLRLPVFRRVAPVDSVDARRRAFAGVVSVTFLISDLAEDAVSRHASMPLRAVIREGGERLYDSAAGAPLGAVLSSQATLQVGDRTWQLEFSAPLHHFRSPGNAALPWLALAGGLLISALLFGLIASLATSSRRAQRIAANITDDLRKSEAQLAESQQRTQKLIETLPNPVYFKGTDGHYLGVNQAWESFFATPREAIVGNTVHDLYRHDPPVGQRLAAMDDVLWKNPGTQVYETTITLASGTYLDAIYYKATFTGPDGKVAGLIGNIIDVTEQRRAERRLRMEHAVTRVLAEADNIQAGLEGVTRAICEAEGWDCARVYLVDERAGLLRFAAAWGIDHEGVRNFIEKTRDMVFAPGQGLAGRVWQTGEPVWTGDISSDPRAIRHYASDYGMRGAFVIPIVSAGKTLGAAAFSSRVVREPDARLVEAAGVVGSQVGQFLIR